MYLVTKLIWRIFGSFLLQKKLNTVPLTAKNSDNSYSRFTPQSGYSTAANFNAAYSC